MEFSSVALVLIGLVLAAWVVGAAFVMLRANAKARRLQALQTSLKRIQMMLDAAPAIPMLVRVDGRIEAPERLARWLGIDKLPKFLSELTGSEGQGLSAEQVEALTEKVSVTQKSAAPFELAITPPGSQRSLAMQGALADPQVSPGGAAMVWVFDFTKSEDELSQLRVSTARAESDFAALNGLIESAPVPMWFRNPEFKLQLVNQAYVDAVGLASAEDVIEEQAELLEPESGQSPSAIAKAAMESQTKSERLVAATIHGERRSLKVSDLPLGTDGVAGYAIDVEEQQVQMRELKAYREAQRGLLDRLSVGVAQFDANEQLVFINRPFRRLFGVSADAVEQQLPFDRFLAAARERGRTPEVRDFPEWRADHEAWFGKAETLEEAWPLPGGTHLRMIAQPLPEGGLVLIAEDQTEGLALSASRDTLLRTRAATLDSLFEALAIFAPDGSMQLWNRSFAGTWGLEAEFLDGHPSANDLIEAIGKNLVKPSQSKAIGAVIRSATLDRTEKAGRIELADGRTLEFAGVPLPDGNGLLTVLDITDSKKAEDALRERALALEEADAVKARFLANMSYEFRTPLTTIGGYAELLKSGAAGEISDDAGEYVDAILTSVERLTDQVENVLDLSQSEAGLLPITKEETDLMVFLTACVREREEAILAAGLRLDLRGDKSVTVEVDPRQLGRSVGALLENTITHTPKGGKVLVEVLDPDPQEVWSASFVISDNGSGMSEDELSRALDGLRQAEDGSLEKRTGLGIPLARQLVEAHGGALEIASEEGVGTAAIIRLP
ncbi:MAG: PAS-domain containing protein [Erythrobacter sp.]